MQPHHAKTVKRQHVAFVVPKTLPLSEIAITVCSTRSYALNNLNPFCPTENRIVKFTDDKAPAQESDP